jgi:hypothetical protein
MSMNAQSSLSHARPQPAPALRHPGTQPYAENYDPFIRHIRLRGLRAEELYDAVRGIAEGEIAAAHFHNAFTLEECEAALQRASGHSGKSPYEGAPELLHIGDSFFETQFGSDRLDAYFANALRDIRQSRELFGTRRNPMDLIRALLDEGSPHGANLLRVGGRVCPIGLARIMEPDSIIMPHIDSACWDMPGELAVQQIESQVSAVVILSKPEAGGDTVIYPSRLSKMQYDAHRLPEPHAYAVGSAALPMQSVTLFSDVGDLILFEARYPHCVTRVQGTPRYTLSAFIGVCRDGRLVLFS